MPIQCSTKNCVVWFLHMSSLFHTTTPITTTVVTQKINLTSPTGYWHHLIHHETINQGFSSTNQPRKENYFFSTKLKYPIRLIRFSSNSQHYLRRTWISFSSDSSFPSNPHRSIHLMATSFPLSDLSSASTTSENAPL